MNSALFCLTLNIVYIIAALILGGLSLYHAIHDNRNGLSWKSHLEYLFTAMMAFICVLSMIDNILILNEINIEANEKLYTIMQMIYVLPGNFVGLILICISGHTRATLKRFINHFFVCLTIIACYAIYPDIGWPWVLIMFYFVYGIFVLFKYISSDKYINQAASNMYVIKYEHIPRTHILLILSIDTVALIYLISLSTPLNDYIVELMFTPVWAFMFYIIRILKESELIEPIRDTSLQFTVENDRPNVPSKEMTATMKYIAENIEKALLDEQFFANKDLNAQLLAEKMGTNRDYISQYLNSIGTNFCTLVNEMRMQYAKELLATTDYSIDDISLKCGYTKIATFRKFFSEAYNCKPEEFERKLK